MYQIPSFQEINYCTENFCIQVFRTIGLSKFVSAHYEGEPICYSQFVKEVIIPCFHPLSIQGMLPVMMIVIILYLQKIIANSDAYHVILKNMKADKSKAAKQRQELVDHCLAQYDDRQEGTELMI